MDSEFMPTSWSRRFRHMRVFCCMLAAMLIVLPNPTRATPPDSAATRHVSAFGSFGLLEVVGVGLSVQLADQYSLGLITTGVALGRGGSAIGVGFRGSYYFSRNGEDAFLWANVIMVDCQYLFPSRETIVSIRDPGGIGIEGLVGMDHVVNPGLGILWAFGVAMNFHSETPPLLLPAFRLGLHIDV